MGLLRRAATRILWFAAALAVAELAHAQQQATEPAVKAAFLYRFASFVEWPDAALGAADAPFVIAVQSAEDTAAELEKLVAGRNAHNRRIVVKRLKEGEGLRGVHILFVGRGDPNTRALTRAAQQGAVLAVTEGDKGLELGGMINFVANEDRVGFEVSLDAAERAGLRISSRMLQVARRVVPRS